MFLLKMLVTTIDELFLFHCWTISFQSLSHASIATTKLLYKGCILYHQCLCLSVWRRLHQKFSNLVKCTSMTCYISSLESELQSWYLKWKKQEQENSHVSLPKTPSFTLPHASSLFPNIKVLLLILCTLPVISCSAERSFSGLKRIRSTMSNERLSSLALLHLHRDINVKVEDIFDEFARRHPRTLKLMFCHLINIKCI